MSDQVTSRKPDPKSDRVAAAPGMPFSWRAVLAILWAQCAVAGLAVMAFLGEVVGGMLLIGITACVGCVLAPVLLPLLAVESVRSFAGRPNQPRPVLPPDLASRPPASLSRPDAIMPAPNAITEAPTLPCYENSPEDDD